MRKHSILLRAAALLLTVITLLTVASCRGNKEPPSDTTPQATEPGTTAPVTDDPYSYDKNGYVLDTLPDVKYNNKTVNILCWIDDAKKTTLPDKTSNDIVDAELYLRRLAVEERLGVIFNVSNTDGGWAYMTPFLQKVEAAQSNDSTYDVICSYSSLGPTMATRGFLKNLNTLTYPETGMPWWPDSVSEWDQYGSLFYVSSNSSMQSLYSMLLTYCNSDMFVDRGMKDPVDEVLDGNWTIETMLGDIAQFETETSAGDTIYALVVDDSTRMDAFYYGCGFRNTNRVDERAELSFLESSVQERITTLIDRMVPVFNSENVTIANNSVKAMYDSRTALMVTALFQISKLENYDYSPVPMPKLDKSQEKYITVQSAGYDVWSVPENSKDPELGGVIIEAIASSDYRNIAPFYFEINTKLRYSKTETIAEMFDIIRDSLTYDFGRINQVELKYRCEAAWRLCFVQKQEDGTYLPYAKNSYAVYVEERESQMQGELSELLRNYRKYS